MTEASDRFRRLAGNFTARVDAVQDDQWENQSPCEEWAARDVVRHVVDNADRFFTFVGRERPPGPTVDEDPKAAWASARDAIQAGLDDPEVAGQEYDGLMGKTTFERSVDQFMGFDLIVHGWDLAKATGGDESIDPDDLRSAYEMAQGFGEMARSPGVFGPEVDVPDDADERARMLAFMGRRA